MLNTEVINDGTSMAKTVKTVFGIGQEKKGTKTYLDKREPILKIITPSRIKELFMVLMNCRNKR